MRFADLGGVDVGVNIDNVLTRSGAVEVSVSNCLDGPGWMGLARMIIDFPLGRSSLDQIGARRGYLPRCGA
jgi:hypothetical protein